MAGRTPWLIALSLLGGTVGCSHTQSNQVPPPVVPVAAKKPVDLPKRQPKAETCVAAGDFSVGEAAAPGRTPLEKEQMRETARKAYQQALALDPQCLPAYQGLARLYNAMEDHEHALLTYTNASKVFPKSGVVWFELGMCHCGQKEWEPGLAALQRAVELEQENRQYVNVLGFALARAGRTDESLACFARIQDEATAHYNVARMLHHMKQDDQSKQHLEVALLKNPNLQDARELLSQIDGQAAGGVKQTSYTETKADGVPSLPAPPVLPIRYTTGPATSEGNGAKAP